MSELNGRLMAEIREFDLKTTNDDTKDETLDHDAAFCDPLVMVVYFLEILILVGYWLEMLNLRRAIVQLQL